MNQAEIVKKLRMTIEEVSDVDLSETSPEENLVEVLGLDSLGGLRMLATIEKRFDVCFPDEEIGKLKSLEALSRSIQKLTQEN